MFIADFHIHSKYARATSKDCVPEMLEMWARRKGLHLIGTGDFTHRVWREELKEKLVPSEEGLYTLKRDFRKEDLVAGADFNPRFIISGEISSIYKKNGKVRKVHNLILLPSLEAAETLSRRLEAIGNLHSDGRPILGLDSRNLLEITLEVCPEAIFIPAHIWTPHFSLFGAYSGFDDINECFEDLTGHIHALETGLSSDQPMNWRISALDRFTLVSNSDAHSPANLAREANIFDTSLSYPHISKALENRDTGEFYGTIEFFPEEGKYHYDGHRDCKVCQKPADTIASSGICPVCGGRITVGVLHRVEALADRDEGFVPAVAKHFESLVPLHEVIAASMGLTTASVKVKEKYGDLLLNLGPELFILREASLDDIEHKAGPLIAEGIRRLRSGKVEIQPGYDGEYGKIKILDQTEIHRLSGQLSLFNEKKDPKQDPKKDPKKDPGKDPEKGPKKDPEEGSKKDLKSSDAKNTRNRQKSASTAVFAPVSDDAFPQRGDSSAVKKVSGDIPYGLNPEQWEAVSASEPAVAVIAGPGTGKTKTLVSRIAYLVEKCGVPASRITAVTFTNKAAGEMRARLEKQFGDKRLVKAMTIGTFHSICLQILSELNAKKSVTLIDEPDALSIVADILKGLSLKKSPRDVLKGISLMKNGALSMEENTEVPAGIYDLYQAQLERYDVLDYDDILLNVLELFENRDSNAGDPQSLPASFSYILTDEFQDINAVQYRLIKAWSKNSQGLFVIGDPDQSIYGFRGSDPGCFKQFFADFSPVRQVTLTQNYRSTPEVICCAKSVILAKNAGGHARLLEAKRETGARVRLLSAEDTFSEALFIAKEINKMVGGIDMLDTQASSLNKKGASHGRMKGFSDMAVLYRTNRQAEAIEQCLLKEGIPYVVAGRDEFLSDLQVRKAVAFFRFLLNPGDLLSLRVCLKETEPRRADLIQSVLESYVPAEKSISSITGLLEKLLSPSASENAQKLIELLLKYEAPVRKEKPRKLIESWINDNSLSGLKCMELLLNTSVLHDRMSSFFQNLLLGGESDVVRSGRKSHSPDAVSLMTLHGAKGLEFPVVFLCGVTDGLIPFRNHNGSCNPDEERRLFYVGITRAQDELILLTSPTPSPFLADLPEGAHTTGNAFVRKKIPLFHQLSFF